MTLDKIKSYAKINLALNIIGKNKFLHKIESIIGFIDLYDLISIRKSKSKNHKIWITVTKIKVNLFQNNLTQIQ